MSRALRLVLTAVSFAALAADLSSAVPEADVAPTEASAWSAPPPPAASVCDNGLIEAGETCEACPADCLVRDCRPSGATVAFAVRLVPAPATKPAAAAIRLAYRSDRLQLPGSGVATELRERVKSLSAASQVVPNDLEHSLRVVLADANGLGGGGFRVSFDRCEGADAARAAGVEDVRCWVEHCSGSGGAISGCGCTVEKVD